MAIPNLARTDSPTPGSHLHALQARFVWAPGAGVVLPQTHL